MIEDNYGKTVNGPRNWGPGFMEAVYQGVALHSGSQPIEGIFTVEPLPADGKRQQVLLKPKSDDSNVTALLLDFTDQVISGIRAEDSFGNITTFTFSNLVRNRELDSALFRFEPPAGVDIVGELD